MSVSQRGYFNQPFEHLFFDVDFIPFPTEKNSAEVLVKMQSLVESGDIAGFIFEPLVQGASGMRMYEPKVLDQLIQIAKSKNVLCIADEVMTGFYRTGTMFAINHITEKPDIICLSKGITGGVLPIGLTVATQSIFEAFLSDDTTKALLHGHSFTANPISCAAVCANLDLLENENVLLNIQNIIDLHARFKQKMLNHSFVSNARQKGTIIALEVKVDDAYAYFTNHELLIRPLGNVIFLNPPYCITSVELENAYQTIENFLNTLG